MSAKYGDDAIDEAMLMKMKMEIDWVRVISDEDTGTDNPHRNFLADN